MNEKLSMKPNPLSEKEDRQTVRFENEARGRILELQRQVAHLKGALAAVDRENEFNRARLVEIRNSLSWRITRPLRRVRRKVAARALSQESH